MLAHSSLGTFRIACSDGVCDRLVLMLGSNAGVGVTRQNFDAGNTTVEKLYHLIEYFVAGYFCDGPVEGIVSFNLRSVTF
jgi:hypothetical protein